MKANIIFAIVLVIGKICVVFQRQVVNLLFRYCALGKLLDRLGTCFLSHHEKELSKQEERIRNASEEELLAQWLSIVKGHAGKYNEICAVPDKMSTFWGNSNVIVIICIIFTAISKDGG